MSKAAKLALEIANDLFTDGSGRKGDHLQITNGVPPNDVYLAGWSESAVAGRVARILEPHLVRAWKPIESAPKDTPVVLGSVDCEIIGHGYAQHITELCTEGHAPTHWQFDPVPPKGEQSA